MKLSLTRREFNLVASKMMAATVAGGSLLSSSRVLAQPKKVTLGTFGNIDVQNYIRASKSMARTFGTDTAVDFVTVRAGSEVLAAMAGGSLDMCNVGSSPMVVGYANGVKASLVYIYKSIIDSEALVVQKSAGISKLADLKGIEHVRFRKTLEVGNQTIPIASVIGSTGAFEFEILFNNEEADDARMTALVRTFVGALSGK